ncbi:tripartite tricarboxylate transporter permease [Agrococcus sp. ARC_14]|uniref:tripartite tricarboxylate transporter permease n=1 Tax=Agrococcus sp. ARC_14 TaxID=2919927 RepID=UPI001F0666ED|nr:tripartite tricarboxylate transporter permease [Agrococcus sp. ARC_14]MCH1881914.1 tripartite tricarboxylate transporter permease [Agrococcus sp. ARC_14]
MSTLDQLLNGFVTVFTGENLLLALVGCVLGMLVGILPGFGPAAAVAILLPVTFTLGPIPAIIMLAAILYGASYGGTITAVLLNVPGETSSVATTLDGYQMAKRGRAGAALTIAAIGSFIGCIVGLAGFVVAAPLSRFALEFGAAEFFALTILGLSLVIGLAGKSMIKAMISAMIGLAVGLVGIDPLQGVPRFTFGQAPLLDGLNFIAVVMGIFGVSELLSTVDHSSRFGRVMPVGRIWPTKQDFRRSVGPILRGAPLGFFFGLLPGSPGAATSFASYAIEKAVSKRKSEFGKGAIEGVAGPETANNSLAIAGMIPLFTLGIPTSATTAILMGAFIINGLLPGPLLFQDHPEVPWAIIASMFIGNVILLILNIPLVRVWILFLKTPFPVLYAIVFGFMILGAYTLDNNVFNIGVLLAFGVLGYLLRKLDVPLAPMALTIVLGPLMESNLRRALSISRGDLSVFVTSPIALSLIIAAVLAIGGTLAFRFWSRRRASLAASAAA